MDITMINSPIGKITLAGLEDCLIGVWLEGQRGLPGEREARKTPILRQTETWLSRYFAGERPAAEELKRLPQVSDFRLAVWKMLCKIPYGATITYGEIAARLAVKLGKPKMSAQAVGGAVGHNPISIVVPCHRVIGADGNLTGYAGGLPAKMKLLVHEGVDRSRFYLPKTR